MNRSTGRTTRMLEYAVEQTAAGRAVYVVMASFRDIDIWRLRYPAIVRWETFETLAGSLDERTLTLRDAHPSCVLLIDHYALGALYDRGCRSFLTWGDRFHAAFVATARQAQETAPVPVEDLDWLAGVDLAFGCSEYAEGMIAFGMSARVLTLDSPDLVRARLRDIGSLRQHMGHEAWFDALAETFHAGVL